MSNCPNDYIYNMTRSHHEVPSLPPAESLQSLTRLGTKVLNKKRRPGITKHKVKVPSRILRREFSSMISRLIGDGPLPKSTL